MLFSKCDSHLFISFIQFQLNRIFFICSFNGFTNPFSFKNINPAIVKEVECFVQNDFIGIIEKKCAQKQTVLTETETTNFFGIYGKEPEKFRFGDFEQDLIARIVEHVRTILSANGPGPEHFSDNIKIVASPNEWYFRAEKVVQEHSNVLASTRTHQFLNLLLTTADKNAKTTKGGYRFDEKLTEYASYFRLLAGPLAYGTLQKNLPLALPSLITVNRFIARTHHSIIEGQLRCNELLAYLNERNLPLEVAIAEDDTRVINRPQYDRNTNQVIGFVLPIKHNGMPIPFSYKARSAEEMMEHFSAENPVASFIKTVMAQPLGNAPAFCLLVYGTDSKHTAEHISRKWNFIEDELAKVNIKVLTISTDSDPKQNSAMKINSLLGTSSKEHEKELEKLLDVEWFSCGNKLNGAFYFQDTPHNGTKLRNLFLKTRGNTKKLPFGAYYIQVDHLQSLRENISKDRHRLTKTILNPIDRQNVSSVRRMCDQSVIDLLKQHVPKSAGTVKFLEILQNIIDAFMNKNLSPEDRLKKMWYSIFILRLWRQYILGKKKLTLKNNFLSQNCYTCLELNAHSLILILLYLKKTNQPQLFQPYRFNSQSCEAFYRKIRSFTTVFSTVANCTTEILGRVKKIQMLSDISVSNTKFIYPRSLNSNELSGSTEFILPTETEIVHIVENCKSKAINDAITLGLLKKPIAHIPCKISPYIRKKSSIRKKFDAMNLGNDPSTINFCTDGINLKNYAMKFQNKEVKETSPYIEIPNNRMRYVVKKTSLCWLLSREATKLSSDRLLRVKNRYNTVELKKTKFVQKKVLVKKYSKKRRNYVRFKY